MLKRWKRSKSRESKKSDEFDHFEAFWSNSCNQYTNYGIPTVFYKSILSKQQVGLSAVLARPFNHFK
jgi:hypothetical protein